MSENEKDEEALDVSIALFLFLFFQAQNTNIQLIYIRHQCQDITCYKLQGGTNLHDMI